MGEKNLTTVVNQHVYQFPTAAVIKLPKIWDFKYHKLLSYSSGVENTTVSFTGLKLRLSGGLMASGGPKERICFFAFFLEVLFLEAATFLG